MTLWCREKAASAERRHHEAAGDGEVSRAPYRLRAVGHSLGGYILFLRVCCPLLHTCIVYWPPDLGTEKVCSQRCSYQDSLCILVCATICRMSCDMELSFDAEIEPSCLRGGVCTPGNHCGKSHTRLIWSSSILLL